MCTCSHDAEFPEDTWNLYQHIERAEGLNVVGEAASAALVFKPHARRLNPEPALLSDDDEELIVKVWFSAPVSVRKVCVGSVGGDADEHPSEVRCFPGQAAMSLGFDSMEDARPAQVIETPIDPAVDASSQCSLRPFTNITFLLLHFPGNHGGADRTRVSYIGLQGEHTHAKRQAVHARYELIPNANDSSSVLGQNTLGSLSKPGT